MSHQQEAKPASEGANIPNEIIERIFSSCPLGFISRTKTVCKGWNAVLSSADFWAHHSFINPNHPWLLFCIDHRTLQNIVYCLSTNTWKTIPISFMPRYATGVKYYASCRGILLVGVGAYPQTLFVCNPLVRKFLQLPPTLSIAWNPFTPKGIVFCEDQVCYKVVAIGPDHTKNSKVIEIYNSCNSSWKTAGEIPHYFTLRKDIVFCKSFFFCLVSHPENLMVYCSIKEDVCKEMNYVKLPVPSSHVGSTRYGTIQYRLVALGGSILLTTATKDLNRNNLSNMSIWEFQMINCNDEGSSAHPNSPWKEIARMPESMCRDFGREASWYECVGEGDYACFRKGMSAMVVTYNLREGSWKWLPRSPCKWVGQVQTIIGFALRPDIKLNHEPTPFGKNASTGGG